MIVDTHKVIGIKLWTKKLWANAGGKIVGDKNIANEFNKYFSETGKKLGVFSNPLYFGNLLSNAFTFNQYQKRFCITPFSA